MFLWFSLYARVKKWIFSRLRATLYTVCYNLNIFFFCLFPFLTTKTPYLYSFREFGIKNSLLQQNVFSIEKWLFIWIPPHELHFYIFNLINIHQKNWESGCIQPILWKNTAFQSLFLLKAHSSLAKEFVNIFVFFSSVKMYNFKGLMNFLITWSFNASSLSWCAVA